MKCVGVLLLLVGLSLALPVEKQSFTDQDLTAESFLSRTKRSTSPKDNPSILVKLIRDLASKRSRERLDDKAASAEEADKRQRNSRRLVYSDMKPYILILLRMFPGLKSVEKLLKENATTQTIATKPAFQTSRPTEERAEVQIVGLGLLAALLLFNHQTTTTTTKAQTHFLKPLNHDYQAYAQYRYSEELYSCIDGVKKLCNGDATADKCLNRVDLSGSEYLQFANDYYQAVHKCQILLDNENAKQAPELERARQTAKADQELKQALKKVLED